jgi:lambda repressor-like predicted transcriptional regulator
MSKAPRRFHPVRLAALERGETLVDVAAAVGVAVPTLRSALASYCWPSLRRRIAEHLDVPEESLFTDDGLPQMAAKSRTAQGLTPTITDERALSIIAGVMRGGDDAA